MHVLRPQDGGRGAEGLRYFIAALVLLTLASHCLAFATAHPAPSGHGGWRYRHRPIIYVVTATNTPGTNTLPAHRTIWHIAWCRPHMGVKIGTATIPPGERQAHYGPHWAYDMVRRGETSVAVNGAVFNEAIAPSAPIGGVGNGNASWKLGSDATAKKFCVGISGNGLPTPEGYPAFRIEPMHYVYARAGTGANAGHMVPFFSVAPLIRKHYSYGFGCVGVLAEHGQFVFDSNAGGWEEGQSLRPQIPLSRTAIAWTTAGDFFIVTADAPTNTQGPGPYPTGDGATWGDVVSLLQGHLPNLLNRDYRACLAHGRHIQIDGAVMFDGGPSTQFGYERVDRRGWLNLDRSAPHGDETAPNFEVPSFLYATAPAEFHRGGNRRRRRHVKA